MVELRYMTHLNDFDEGAEFILLIEETLGIISEHDVDIDVIKKNVIFVFPSKPALIGGADGHSVIITFNLPKLREDIEAHGDNYNERAKDIIAHEIAHYVLGNYNQISTPEIERATDDLSESWGFGRAYRGEPAEEPEET